MPQQQPSYCRPIFYPWLMSCAFVCFFLLTVFRFTIGVTIWIRLAGYDWPDFSPAMRPPLASRPASARSARSVWLRWDSWSIDTFRQIVSLLIYWWSACFREHRSRANSICMAYWMMLPGESRLIWTVHASGWDVYHTDPAQHFIVVHVGSVSLSLLRVMTRPEDRVRRYFKHPPVESGRVKRSWKSHASSRVGSGNCKISRGRAGLPWLDTTRY